MSARPLFGLAVAVALALAPPGSASVARAADGGDARRSRRDPRGSVLLGLTGGATFSSELTYGSVGAQLGYAVLDGVVPGVRGNLFFGDVGGGEVVGTLWLTPPIDFEVVPFVVGEVGYAAREFSRVSFDGALYGVGGGVHIGRIDEPFSLRAGLIYRYYDFGTGNGTLTPLVMASLRL